MAPQTTYITVALDATDRAALLERARVWTVARARQGHRTRTVRGSNVSAYLRHLVRRDIATHGRTTAAASGTGRE